MDDITLEALEYPLVLQELKGFTSTPVGEEAVLNLRPFTDFSRVEEAFKELKESSAIVDTTGGLPLSGVEDIRPVVKKTAPEGACLKPSELLDVKNTLGAVSGVSTVLTPAFTGSFPLTSARIASLSDYKDILKELNAILDAKGEIKDDASSRLFRLRKDIRSSRARARALVEELSTNKKFKEFLRDEIFTIRDDRYVLCVEAAQHTRLPGVVHGRSGSGSTYYIEPLQAVELNNRLAILKKEEMAEEMEILKRATGLVSARAGEIQRDLKTVAYLDSVQARARFKKHLKAVLPGLSPAASDVAVRFKNARHPLLVFKDMRGGRGGEGGEGGKGGEAVTPVDIILEKGESVLVISGANTGGKTVALKTLGLMCLMVNSGMAVPADEGSEAVFFNNIFADIGDRQDIAESLSTFSAHLKRTGEILERSAPGTLVLVDEIGVGTDPSEGGALALAFLEALKKKGARTAVTTHLNFLKAHAHSDPSFQNASVAFDEETLKPRYKLRYGTPGASLALSVARSLGISKELIESAAEKLKGDEGAFVQSVEALQRETESLSDAKRRVEELEEKRRKALERLRKDRTKMLEKAKKMVEEVVKGAREEIKEISARFEEEGVKVQKAPAIKAVSGVGERIAKLLSGGEGGERFVPQVGDSVEIEGTGTVGEVIRVDREGGGGKKAELLVGGMKVWIALERLRKGYKQKPRRKRKRPSVEEAFTGAGPGPTVNLIGMRVDEALQVVEKAIDRAHMEGIERVEVIHGIGTGSLARAVGEYLKSNELVKGFNPGDTGAVTVVEIA